MEQASRTERNDRQTLWWQASPCQGAWWRGWRARRVRGAVLAVLCVIAALAAGCSDSDDSADDVVDEVADSAGVVTTEVGSFDEEAEADVVANDDAAAGDVEDGERFAGDADDATDADVAADEVAEETVLSADVDDGSDVASVLGAEAVPIVDDPVSQLGRSIIFDGFVVVEVDDVAAAGQRAVTEIQSLGGIVFGQQATSDPTPEATFTFRVPPADFQAALASLGSLGVPLRQEISADDVTERVVDLRSRITTAEVSVERLRGLLTEAVDFAQVAALESSLVERETTLEQLRGQLRTLTDRVALASITLQLTQGAVESALEVLHTAAAGSEPERCPGSDELDVDEGDAVTMCVAVTNVGDTSVDQLDISDRTFDLGVDDVVVTEGDLASPLAPGERIVAAYVVEASPDPSRLVVDARPVDVEGVALPSAVAVQIQGPLLSVDADDALPGFAESVGNGWDALQRITAAVLVVVGVLVPFLWLVPLAALAWVALRRRSSGRTPSPTSEPAGATGRA